MQLLPDPPEENELHEDVLEEDADERVGRGQAQHRPAERHLGREKDLHLALEVAGEGERRAGMKNDGRTQKFNALLY